MGTSNPSLFSLQVAGNVGPNATDQYNLGASGTEWNNLYVKNIVTPSSGTGQFGYWTSTTCNGVTGNCLSPTNTANQLVIGQATTPLASTGEDIEVNSLGNAALVVANTGGSGDIFTASSGAAAKFVINKNGNVGIGTTATPGQLLDMRLPGSNTGDIFRLGNVNNTSSGFMGINASNGIYFNGTNSFEILIGGGSSRLHMDSKGNVGIGPANTSPLATLDVRPEIGTVAVASISGQTSFASLVVDNSGAGDLFAASSSGLNRFVITQAGNVGYWDNIPK